MNPTPILIGEQLNLSGSRSFAATFHSRDWGAVRSLLQSQMDAGAAMLDVCLMGGEDQETAATAFFDHFRHLQYPLVIDTTSEDVMEIALTRYPFISLLNSANLARPVANCLQMCTLAREFKIPLVFGCIDGEGLAATCARKLDVARRSVDYALSQGLEPEQIVIDPLVLPALTDPQGVAETLQAIATIAEKLPGIRTLLAVSNVSYGMTDTLRTRVDRDFLSRATVNGLSFAIVNITRVHPILWSPELHHQI